MRRAAFPILAILILALSPNLLQGQVVKGSWAKLDAQPAGTRVVVRLHTGTRITCTLRETTDSELLVTLDSSGEMRIAKGEVAKVTTEARYKDSLKNGVAWGLGLGIGFGIANGRLQGPAAGAGTVAVWTGLGILIDRLHKGREVLYKAR